MTRILIADDEADIAESTAELLRSAGHTVTTVAEAGAILPTLRRERPAILLQDVRMPGLDIKTHVKALRDDPAIARTFVVIFTATMSAREMMREVPADDAIEKPFDPRGLLDAIRRWDEKARQR